MSEPCQVARDIHSKKLEGRNALHDCIPNNNGTQHRTIILRVCRGQSSWTGLSVFVFLSIALRLKLGVGKVALGTLGQLKFTLIGFKGGGYLAHFLHALSWMISKQA